MKPPQVLIVDDEFLIRAHIVAIFEDAGCSIIEASSASEAIPLLEKHRSLQTVITDISMPGLMDGMGLAHHIAEQWPETQVIVCSGNELPFKSALPQGAMFFAKPMQLTVLEELAAGICAR